MCSNASPARLPPPPDGGLEARLGRAIEELAATTRSGEQAAGQDLAALLAAAWALVAEADPELADRTARYSR
jgi:hypothetical protein